MDFSFREGELDFEFKDAESVEKLDAIDPVPQGMMLVDFVVTESDRVLLVEVKDPSHSGAPKEERRAFARTLGNRDLIAEQLVPKARDSYAYLHLMAQDSKPFVYVVLLGLERVVHDAALLTVFKDRLLARLNQEADDPWRRPYVRDCVVVTSANWNQVFPRYPLTRTK